MKFDLFNYYQVFKTKTNGFISPPNMKIHGIHVDSPISICNHKKLRHFERKQQKKEPNDADLHVKSLSDL